MRPRSRLLCKRRAVLPTIKEGTEESIRDLNEANTLHTHSQPVSSEDYLLSICHLAHPTFANRDVSRFSDALQQVPRLSRPRITSSPEVQPENGGDPADARDLMFGSSDPLEYLYGHHSRPSALTGGVRKTFAEGSLGRARQSQARTRAHSIPRTSSPEFPRQRKSSCPELHTDKSSVSSVSLMNGSSRIRPAAEENPSCIKQSLISQWISDCRLAWREARLRACMLPAIAEV